MITNEQKIEILEDANNFLTDDTWTKKKMALARGMDGEYKSIELTPYSAKHACKCCLIGSIIRSACLIIPDEMQYPNNPTGEICEYVRKVMLRNRINHYLVSTFNDDDDTKLSDVKRLLELTISRLKNLPE